MEQRSHLQLAYELAVYRVMQARLMSLAAEAKDGRTEIIAPEARYVERFVSVKAVSEVLDMVMTREHALMTEMGRWAWALKPPPDVRKAPLGRKP
jgi:hypothetical protein